MSSDDDNIVAAKDDLQRRCQDIQAKLEQLQAQLSETNTRTLAGLSQSEMQTVELQQQERMLEAQIEQQSKGISDTGDILPSNSPVLHELLSEELTDDVEQLQQTLSLLRKQRTVLQQQIENESEMKHELERLRSLLEEGLADTENVPRPESSNAQALATASAKRSELEKLYKMRLKQMVTFVRKYFPPLTNEDIKEWKKTYSTSSRVADASTFLSLETILENLVNKTLETPNDPYIDTNDTLWPPYVNMLLRSGIILGHPSDVHRIRLTPYHY